FDHEGSGRGRLRGLGYLRAARRPVKGRRSAQGPCRTNGQDSRELIVLRATRPTAWAGRWEPSGRPAAVAFQQPAEHFPAHDFNGRAIVGRAWWRAARCDVPQALVRPKLVIVLQKHLQQTPKMHLATDREVIEALPLYFLHEALSVRNQVGLLRPDAQNL